MTETNISISSSECSENEPEKYPSKNFIPTHLGYRPAKVIYERPPSYRKTIRCDNKKVQARTLPRVTNYNVRALFSKIGNLAQDMKERESD